MRPPIGAGGPGSSLRAVAPSLSLALVVVLMMGGLGFTWLSGERSVTLVLDGREVPTRTHAATVGDLLDRAGIELERGDALAPSIDATVVDGMVVHLDRGAGLAHVPAQSAPRPLATRTTRSARIDADAVASDGSHVLRTEVRTETLAHGVVEVPTDALPEGERREAQPGSDGIREVVVAIVEVEGEEIAREVIVARVLTAAVDRVVEVGTAAPPEPEVTPEPIAAPEPAPQTASAPPDPDPEPEPEPSAEPAPAPEEEPAPPANVQEGGASWYDNPYGGMTAAHRTLPRGTIVTVTNLANGKQVQVRINDRGPYVQGRIIDLNREAFAQLASPSRGVVQVRIEW